MIVYRLAKSEFAQSLQSSGAPNRWNRAREFVIYTSGSISLCALELLAHTSGLRPAGSYKMMKIKIDESPEVTHIREDDLPKNWNSLSAYGHTQQLGSDWYTSQTSLVLKVPSAIIPTESNYVINKAHSDYSETVHLIELQDFFWDKRFPSN